MGDTTAPAGTPQWGRRHAPIKPRRVGRLASPTAQGDQAKARQHVVERADDAALILTLRQHVVERADDAALILTLTDVVFDLRPIWRVGQT
jgi:hypothetical protein